MQIPPELEQELKEFAFIIDNNKKIKDVYLSKGMATILEPYSKTVQEERYAYTEYNHELYDIYSTEEHEGEDFYFECQLDLLTAGINKYGTNPIIIHIKRLLEDTRYNILDIDDPDITDMLDNFEYFRAVLHKRHMEFTRAPTQDFFYDQNIEGTARLFVAGNNDLWKGEQSLLPVHDYEWQKSELKYQRNIFTTVLTGEHYSTLIYLVLLEDRIIRLNYSTNASNDVFTDYNKDAETYLFEDNLILEEFNVPASPEGFLLLKMMEI
ncbi:TPA: hypothetical protein ACJXXT_000223 [Pseudomonas aeruginosa]